MAKTAIEQARDTFKRLINLKIDKPPLPRPQITPYAFSTLPGGQILMSSGQTKVSAPAKKIDRAQGLDRESLAPIGQKGKTGATIMDLLLNIAVPASQMGTGENRAFTFANYINQALRPQLPTAPGLGAPALLPEAARTANYERPSAIANLPPLTLKLEDQFESPLAKYKTFLENTDKIQQDLAKRVLAQLNRGERTAAYATLGGLGRAPLITGYRAKDFILPAPQSAEAATIKPQVPQFNAASVY